MPEVKVLNVNADDLPDELREAFEGFVSKVAGTQRSSDPLADVAALRELYERYTAPVTFSSGDLVTPRKGSHLKHAGKPFIVLETIPNIPPNFTGKDPTDTEYGSRPQVRVATVCSCPEGGFLTWWVEGHLLETWTPPTTEKLNS